MAPTPERPDVWAGHLEVGRPDGQWVMLAVVGNGLVSAYLSSDRGTLGLGERDGVRPAGPRWLAALQDGLALLPLTGPPELPAPGRVVIRAMTYGGPRAVETGEEDLAEGRHPAAALYRGAQDVVAQISLFEDRLRGTA